MRGLTINKQVALALTAEDWDLYDMPESKVAAEALNYVIMREVNAGMDRLSVKKKAYKVMSKYLDTGIMDTEPRAILQEILDEIYR